MGSGYVNANAWRVTMLRSLSGAAETACNSDSTVRRVVSRKRDAVRLKAVRRDRRLFRRAFFQIKWANFMVEFYHRLPSQSRELYKLFLQHKPPLCLNKNGRYANSGDAICSASPVKNWNMCWTPSRS